MKTGMIDDDEEENVFLYVFSSSYLQIHASFLFCWKDFNISVRFYIKLS